MKHKDKIGWIIIISLFLLLIIQSTNYHSKNPDPYKNFLEDLGCKNGEVVNHEFLARNYGKWITYADDIYVYTKDGHLYINSGERKDKSDTKGVPTKDKQYLVSEDVWDYINNNSLYKVECKTIDNSVIVSLTEQ